MTMKIFKKFFPFLLLIAVGMVFSGCASGNDTAVMDIDALSKALLENIEFEDELTLLDDAMVGRLYDIEDYVSARVYIGSGATAEEIAVFEFDSREKAAAGLKVAVGRVEEQREDFAGYLPGELKKLDNAVAGQYGRYVILCVSGDDSARELIAKYAG